MTHVRRPNRRPVPGMTDLVDGGICTLSGKVRYLDARTAGRALTSVASHDPDPERVSRLEVYHCARCADWHVGHRSEGVPR